MYPLKCTKEIMSACLIAGLAVTLGCLGASSTTGQKTDSNQEYISSGPNPSVPGLSMIYQYTTGDDPLYELFSLPTDCSYFDKNGNNLTTYQISNRQVAFEKPVISCEQSKIPYDFTDGNQIEGDEQITLSLIYIINGSQNVTVNFSNMTNLDLTGYALVVNPGFGWPLLVAYENQNKFILNFNDYHLTYTEELELLNLILNLPKDHFTLLSFAQDHTLQYQIVFSLFVGSYNIGPEGMPTSHGSTAGGVTPF